MVIQPKFGSSELYYHHLKTQQMCMVYRIFVKWEQSHNIQFVFLLHPDCSPDTDEYFDRKAFTLYCKKQTQGVALTVVFPSTWKDRNSLIISIRFSLRYYLKIPSKALIIFCSNTAVCFSRLPPPVRTLKIIYIWDPYSSCWLTFLPKMQAFCVFFTVCSTLLPYLTIWVPKLPSVTIHAYPIFKKPFK